MSEKTSKLFGWQPQAKPEENGELKRTRQLITEIIFGIYHRKKEILARKEMPAQPVSLYEIFKEYESRVTMLQNARDWPYILHCKRWVDRRVNETACPTYAEDGQPKVVCVTAGKYQPSPFLFEKTQPTLLLEAIQ